MDREEWTLDADEVAVLVSGTAIAYAFHSVYATAVATILGVGLLAFAAIRARVFDWPRSGTLRVLVVAAALFAFALATVVLTGCRFGCPG